MEQLHELRFLDTHLGITALSGAERWLKGTWSVPLMRSLLAAGKSASAVASTQALVAYCGFSSSYSLWDTGLENTLK